MTRTLGVVLFALILGGFLVAAVAVAVLGLMASGVD